MTIPARLASERLVLAGLILAVLMLPLAPVTAAQTQTVREWRYVPDPEGERCTVDVRKVPLRTPALGEIRVTMRASSFNGRDRYRLAGSCDDVQVPLSDGAGEVTAVGEGVTRFVVGDRVVTTFFAEAWIAGDQRRRRLPGRSRPPDV